MKINVAGRILIICTCLFFTACSNTPEEYFDRAVLNTNMITGFATNGMARELESTPSIAGEKAGTYVSMARSEVMKGKIDYLDNAFNKIKALKETDDTKDILHSSIALYEYVLPVYKTEYMQVAKLHDAQAPEATTDSLINLINKKYFPKYEELYNKLIGHGKSYARRHDIKVNWAM